MNDAQSSAAVTGARTLFEWGRIRTESDWFLPLAAFALALAFIVWLYRRDTRNLRPGWAVVLCLLRCTAAAAVFIVFLQPQYRSERDVIRRSRALVLVDTSLSMGFANGEPNSAENGPSRAEAVIEAFESSELLPKLREVHDVVVGRFDRELGEVAVLARYDDSADDESSEDGVANGNADGTAVENRDVRDVDFGEALLPRGGETRLGDSLAEWLYDQRSLPIAGMIVFSDGGQNAGEEPRTAAELARESRIPLFPVGLGSDARPANVRINELVAPTRAYPGDAYQVTGYVQGEGFAGQRVTVELETRSADDENAPWTAVDAREFTFEEDAETVPLEFELSSATPARYLVRMRVDPPTADQNATDDEQTVAVDVVERKTRVLLFAGGPTREYRFLRNLLYRDADVLVDVVLQTGQPGINQDARQVLSAVPDTREALAEYDAIVAIDPDWTALTPATIDAVERFVAESAGGLIVIAGPIHTDSLANDERLGKIRALYPVEFQRHLPMLGEGRFSSDEAWPLDFTREGTEAEFLWLGDTSQASQQAWSEFDGVYGYFSVRRPKPGATVYASFSAPASSDSDAQATYFAGQFYGAGRVFYAASGEMWRLRSIDEAYFEQLYTKLVRHVSEGRLSRDSDRGVLLVERDRYWLGDTVTVRAQITPEDGAAVDQTSLAMDVISPDGSAERVDLVADADTDRPGMFFAEFVVRQEGFHELEVPLPGPREQVLRKRIRVGIPDLERRAPQRHDDILNELATISGGTYYIGIDAALGRDGETPVMERLKDRTERTTVSVGDAPETLWDRPLVMFLICGLFAVEWTLRRFLRLA